MKSPRVSLSGAAEGAARKWGMAKVGDTAPRCIVRVDWPKCVEGTDGGVRLDLEAVAFAEYLVGANANRPSGTGRGVMSLAKGQGYQPVKLFGSHSEIPDYREFGSRWLAGDKSLGGQDRSRWSLHDAWHVHLMRRQIRARNYRRSPREQHQFRIRLCPDPVAGRPLAKAKRMEEFARGFMSGLEADFSAESGTKQHFVWIGAAHYNVDHPHVHIGVRGISVDEHAFDGTTSNTLITGQDHVFFSQKYLRPNRRELERDPRASGPIERRARAVLAEMMSEKQVRHAG